MTVTCNKSVFIVLCLAAVSLFGCVAAQLQSDANSNLEYLVGSNPPENTSALTIRNDLSRGQGEITAVVITEPLLRAEIKETLSKNNQLTTHDINMEIERQILSKVKQRTCIEFDGPREVYNYSTTWDYTKWKGIIVTENQEIEAMPLFFSPISKIACTKKPIDLSRSFEILIKTQFSQQNSLGLIWRTNTTWKYTPIYNLEEKFMKLNYADSSKKDDYIGIFGPNLETEKAKVLLTAIKTGRHKYLQQELPLRDELYTPHDRMVLTILLEKVAEGQSEDCDSAIIDYLIQVGPAYDEVFYNSMSKYEMNAALKCARFATYVYKWYPSLREKIITVVNDKLMFELKYLASDPTVEDIDKITELTKIYKIIHKDISSQCISGQKEKCILAEFVLDNMAVVNQAIKKLKMLSANRMRTKEVLKELNQILEQEKARKRKTAKENNIVI